MTDEKDPASEDVTTPAADTSADEAVEATEAAQESVDDLKARIADFESRLTKEGRSKATIKSQLEELRSELNEAVSVNDRWHQWWLENAASEDEKKEARAEAQSAEVGEVAASKTREGHWQAIAEEENPLVKRALTAAAKKGEFMTAGQIGALRETLESADEPTEKPKSAPKVTGPRATGAPKTSFQDRMEEARKKGDFEGYLSIKTEEALASGR